MQHLRVSNRNVLWKYKLTCWLRFKYVEQSIIEINSSSERKSSLLKTLFLEENASFRYSWTKNGQCDVKSDKLRNVEE